MEEEPHNFPLAAFHADV